MTVKRWNDGQSVYPSNRQLSILALLCDNMAMVVVVVVVSCLNVLRNTSILPEWIEISDSGISCLLRKSAEYKNFKDAGSLKILIILPQTTPLDSELAYNHKVYTHTHTQTHARTDTHTHRSGHVILQTSTHAHTYTHPHSKKKAFERLKRVIFFFKSVNLFISSPVSE